MPNYRRSDVKGGTYFFTVVTHRRQKILCNPDIRSALRNAVRIVQAKQRFVIDCWVLLPDHLHCIWMLPSHDSDFSTRWANIKRIVSKQCGGNYYNASLMTGSKKARQERTIWQRRYWEHLVRNEDDFNRCRDYLHWNPVKHGYVATVEEWPYSTFHRFVKQGWYSKKWGGGEINDIDGSIFGE